MPDTGVRGVSSPPSATGTGSLLLALIVPTDRGMARLSSDGFVIVCVYVSVVVAGARADSVYTDVCPGAGSHPDYGLVWYVEETPTTRQQQQCQVV